MPDRWAFVVAVEKYLHPEFGTVPYAEAGAKALAEALAGCGYPKANQIVLLGPHATKTAVESRLRKLRKAIKKGDEVVVYWCGRASTPWEGKIGHFICWDSIADDLEETSLSVATLVSQITGSKSAQVAFLWEFDGDKDDAEGTRQSTLSPNDIHRMFRDSANAVCLTACDEGQGTYPNAALKSSPWTHLLVEAFAGRAPKATDGKGRVTAVSLHRFVEDELPRLLRKHIDGRASQNPLLFGEQNGGFVLADLTDRPGGGEGIDAGRLRRVVFRSDSHGRVKDLTGFRKTYSVPENASSSNRKFVARLSAADLKADLDSVFEAAREHLGYKRKDIEVTADGDGFGFLRGPDFDYTVSVALDPEDPSQVTWRREVGQFADPAFVRSPGFDAVFGKLFDQLAFEFTAPVDVPALVDRLEDRPPKGVKVRVSSDGGECDVSLAGFTGRVVVGRTGLVVRGRAGDSAGLLDQFLRFVQAVGPVGEPPALPGGPG